jgi:Uma2 family endonuclease
MRAVLLEVPEHMLEERRRLGIDGFDEMWDGVLHMVPPPSDHHQRAESELVAALLPLARARNLVASVETGLFRPGQTASDYRVPDLVVSRPENRSHHGVEGRAELVIELRSPHDETYHKLGFYAEMEVQQLLVIDPDTFSIEAYVLRGAQLMAVLPGPDQSVTIPCLEVSLSNPSPGMLRVCWADGGTDITLP